MKKRRCLVISSPYSWGGGIKTMVDEGLKILESLGYKTTLVMPSYTKESRNNEIKAKKISTPWFINFDKYPLLHHIVFGLKLKNLRQRYDIALAIVATSHTALPLALSGKRFGIWVATNYADELEAKFNSNLGDEPAKRLKNSIQWQFLEKIEKYVLRKATSILALSDYTASRLLRLEPRIKSKLSVFHPPINTDLFSPGISTKKVNGLIVNTGRINDPRKNTHLLIKSFARILKSFPQARLLLVGDKADGHLIKLIESLGLKNFVEIIPEKPREEITSYLRRAEVFVATPVQEGLGISILEAMSCGLPVVITRCGGPETIIKRSGGGIITNNNEKDFSEAVINLLLNKPLRIKMGFKGRKYIRNNLSFTSQRKRLALELNKQYAKQ
ncbi:MAG: hypothetical protein KatS3mg088_311 [Patescibacteria group bacterium]|nr:MAG: hypothetical protein KatS3mg088_311 [Patescibacteria group bacterium]